MRIVNFSVHKIVETGNHRYNWLLGHVRKPELFQVKLRSELVGHHSLAVPGL